MRCLTVSLMLFAVLSSAGLSYGEEEGKKRGMAYGLERGCANVLLGWLEMPRCMIYEGTRIPIAGLAFGPIEGAGYTVGRTLLGMADFATLGLMSKGLYSEALPDFVWQAPWFPRSQK